MKHQNPEFRSNKTGTRKTSSRNTVKSSNRHQQHNTPLFHPSTETKCCQIPKLGCDQFGRLVPDLLSTYLILGSLRKYTIQNSCNVEGWSGGAWIEGSLVASTSVGYILHLFRGGEVLVNVVSCLVTGFIFLTNDYYSKMIYIHDDPHLDG